MKKLAFATAIAAAATLSTGAHAVVTSNITAVELEVSGIPSQVDCATGTYNPGFVTGLALTGIGTGTGEINWTGQICLDVGGGAPYVSLVFSVQGQATATGTQFTNGKIDYYVDFGPSSPPSGWMYAGTVDASATPIVCEVSATAVGLQWAGGGANTLPGAPNAVAPAIPTNAVCETTLLGLPASIYLTGTNSD